MVNINNEDPIRIQSAHPESPLLLPLFTQPRHQALSSLSEDNQATCDALVSVGWMS